MDVLKKFQDICKLRGWRCTPQRLAVFAYMNGNFEHPSVDRIWSALKKKQPALTRESVYRILNEFSEAGLIRRIDQIESALYDSQTLPHGHFICERCKKIIDFTIPDLTCIPPDSPLEKGTEHIELRITGLCRECRAAEAEKSAKK